MLPAIVFLTSYPPRECGIATFSQDLVHALNKQFHHSFNLRIAAVDNGEHLLYPKEVRYSLNAKNPKSYVQLTKTLSRDPSVELVVVQHEFGFYNRHEEDFLQLLRDVDKPVVTVFHTVLPDPNPQLRQHVKRISGNCSAIIVMTEHAKQLLVTDYNLPEEQIELIPHGTHLVQHLDKNVLKAKHGFSGRKILSTFGLISSGKNIETTLSALPAIVAEHPDVLFLAIGKTHPEVLKNEGEHYRESLGEMTRTLGIENHVQFINSYVSLPELLEYLQLTDVYLFTSKDPNQAVSGTFSYALSCGCPIISTPIPHAVELLENDPRMIVPFSDPAKLAQAVNNLLGDEELLRAASLNGLHRIAGTSWENVAVRYALLFQKTGKAPVDLEYRWPEINLYHIRQMTTHLGMIQFSQLSDPDIESGYTLDDNARALIAICQHYELTRNEEDLKLIRNYIAFIELCLQPQGYFLNYVDKKKAFTDQNFATNLSDSNGRAMWALGYAISLKNILPEALVRRSETVFRASMQRISGMHSTRAMSFAIKGLYYYNTTSPAVDCEALITVLANRLVQMYLHESSEGWEWFESYLTYANSLLPEALLCAWEVTRNETYRSVAKLSLDFLLSQTFHEFGIKVISNRGWMQKGEIPEHFGEQPIDVAYTVLTLSRFYNCFREDEYLLKMETAFNWFLGHNHLHRMLYNPCTGGCCDGLEEHHVNLNQGAESTVSYLMARLTIETHKGDLLHLHQSLKRQGDILRFAAIEKQKARQLQQLQKPVPLTKRESARNYTLR
jgi:glycosyltransferase involved in cell wall biosynthesis